MHRAVIVGRFRHKSPERWICGDGGIHLETAPTGDRIIELQLDNDLAFDRALVRSYGNVELPASGRFVVDQLNVAPAVGGVQSADFDLENRRSFL